jgi:hypothetical protein
MDRRELIKLGAVAAVSGFALKGSAEPAESSGAPVEQWGVFEAEVKGPSSGNPFVDVRFGARFTLGHRSVEAAGFYDGEGVYRVRFSPDAVGRWSFETTGSVKELAGHAGSFECVPAKARQPRAGGHGTPVSLSVCGWHAVFSVWNHMLFVRVYRRASGAADAGVAEEAGFNKVRMCLLPKPLGERKPVAMPFERIGAEAAEALKSTMENSEEVKSAERYDLTRLNPAYFRHVEERIQDLMGAGIEADVILFHPYDAWGFKAMGEEADDRYLRYAVARLSAYRNVWWSIANEYDLVKSKSMKDWDRFFRIVEQSDPYGRLRSIHHSKVVYDHAKPWCTHASLQEYDFQKSAERLTAWNKPIIYDEIQYEGNIARRWGNLSPQEMTNRFWRAIVAGAYATHGETYISTDGNPVWSDAGTLHGTSAARITFLRKLLESTGTTGLMAAEAPYYTYAANPGERYLYFFDFHCAAEYEFPLPEKGNSRLR